MCSSDFKLSQAGIFKISWSFFEYNELNEQKKPNAAGFCKVKTVIPK